MASGASTYAQNAILNLVLSNTSYSVPGTLYVGLWTTTLSASSTGATAGEPSGANYSRVSVVNNSTNFPAASGGSKSNGASITFPTSSGSWGTVTYLAICDSGTTGAGNILYYGQLTNSITVGVNTTISFPISSLTFTLT